MLKQILNSIDIEADKVRSKTCENGSIEDPMWVVPESSVHARCKRADESADQH